MEERMLDDMMTQQAAQALQVRQNSSALNRWVENSLLNLQDALYRLPAERYEITVAEDGFLITDVKGVYPDGRRIQIKAYAHPGGSRALLTDEGRGARYDGGTDEFTSMAFLDDLENEVAHLVFQSGMRSDGRVPYVGSDIQKKDTLHSEVEGKISAAGSEEAYDLLIEAGWRRLDKNMVLDSEHARYRACHKSAVDRYWYANPDSEYTLSKKIMSNKPEIFLFDDITSLLTFVQQDTEVLKI